MYYIKMNSNEKVDVEDATEYVKEKLGIEDMHGVGANDTFTLEQIDFLETFTDWYFSGEWTLEKEQEEEDEAETERQLKEWREENRELEREYWRDAI